jgi:hypothetical protein
MRRMTSGQLLHATKQFLNHVCLNPPRLVSACCVSEGVHSALRAEYTRDPARDDRKCGRVVQQFDGNAHPQVRMAVNRLAGDLQVAQCV